MRNDTYQIDVILLLFNIDVYVCLCNLIYVELSLGVVTSTSIYVCGNLHIYK